MTASYRHTATATITTATITTPTPSVATGRMGYCAPIPTAALSAAAFSPTTITTTFPTAPIAPAMARALFGRLRRRIPGIRIRKPNPVLIRHIFLCWGGGVLEGLGGGVRGVGGEISFFLLGTPPFFLRSRPFY